MDSEQDHQQHDSGVPFAVAHELQNFRLLELPPDLVELLEGPSPPQYVPRTPATAAAWIRS